MLAEQGAHLWRERIHIIVHGEEAIREKEEESRIAILRANRKQAQEDAVKKRDNYGHHEAGGGEEE